LKEVLKMVGFRKSFRPSKVSLPKPIKVGEEYDVEIREVGSRGDGIARIKNFVVFVAGTKKGEKAHIRIKEVRNRFAIGEKTEGKAAEEAPEEVKLPEVTEEIEEEPTEE
jgi:predicted RNA-binding protein with TRAM domain